MRTVLAFASVALLSTASAHAAVTPLVTLDLSTSNAGEGSVGNDVFYTLSYCTNGASSCSSSQKSQLRVHASAWTATIHTADDPSKGIKKGDYKSVEAAALGRWSGGAGVTASGDQGGAYNLHTVDNYGTYDFIMLQFDRVVKLDSVAVTAWEIATATTKKNWNGTTTTTWQGTSYADTDLRIGYGNSIGAYTTDWSQRMASVAGATPLDILDGAHSEYTATNTVTAGSTINLASLAPDGVTQFFNTWFIGADTLREWEQSSQAKKYDAFKLDLVKVKVGALYDPVPEPATWMSMIAGFGLIGGALRRRTRQTARAAHA